MREIKVKHHVKWPKMRRKAILDDNVVLWVVMKDKALRLAPSSTISLLTTQI